MNIGHLKRKIAKLTQHIATLCWPDPEFQSRPTWIASDWQATLVDTDTGRVLAYVWHDDCGKFYPTIFVSPWRALHLLNTQLCYVSTLASFPRIALDLARIKTDSLLDAQRSIEAVLR
jgi:hypothetical protein